jgi:hypothetical protein
MNGVSPPGKTRRHRTPAGRSEDPLAQPTDPAGYSPERSSPQTKSAGGDR